MTAILLIVGILVVCLFATTKRGIEETHAEIKAELGDAYNPDAAGNSAHAAGCIVAAAILTAIILVAIIGSMAPAGLLLPK